MPTDIASAEAMPAADSPAVRQPPPLGPRSRVLVVINNYLEAPRRVPAGSTEGPVVDYHALADGLRSRFGTRADFIDHFEVVGKFGRAAGMLGAACRNQLAAWLAYRARTRYDVIFTVGESVAFPLALLLLGTDRRPRHVTVGHRLSAGKKRLLYRGVAVHRAIDKIFVYSEFQRRFAISHLGMPDAVVELINYFVDTDFFRHDGSAEVDPGLICSVGSEWRDHATLIRAVSGLPGVTLKMTGFSPWAKRTGCIRPELLPPNVHVARYDYPSLRQLYATSVACVVPLLDADFAAGITSALEAMAMGKAVIMTSTTGNLGSHFRDEENCLLVPPHDANRLALAVRRLQRDVEFREALGRRACRWATDHATASRWVGELARGMAPQAR